MLRVSVARSSCGRTTVSLSRPKKQKNIGRDINMNQLAIVLCALAGVVTAAPLPPYSTAIPLAPYTTPIPILRQSADGPNPDGSYSYNYETANGIQAQEIGYLNYAGTQAEAREAQGSYSYTAPNGEIIQVTYVANENGFQPQGSHIPPIPPQILKALEYIAAHPEENNIGAQ